MYYLDKASSVFMLYTTINIFKLKKLCTKNLASCYRNHAVRKDTKCTFNL